MSIAKISMINLAQDEKNNHKYLQHNRSRNSARRSTLVDNEQKFMLYVRWSTDDLHRLDDSSNCRHCDDCQS